MADNKKYYYIRLKENFFDSDEIKLLESIPNDGYKFSNILLKMYLKSLKYNGRLMFNERIPFNAEMLATVTGHSLGDVTRAIDMFKKFGLIEVLETGEIYMLDIQSFIGKTTTEADRKRSYRKEIEDKKAIGTNVRQNSDKSIPEIEIEKDIEIKKDIDVVDDEKKINNDDKSKAYSALVHILEQNGFGTIGGIVSTDINKELDDFAEANNGDYREAYSVILQAIKISVGNGVCKFKYLWNVTRDWYQRKLFTLKDIEASEKKRDDEKSKSKQRGYNNKPQRVEPQMITEPVAESNVDVSDVAKELAELKEMGLKTKLEE
ncbi:phage replisome organizer N-terminal domain-containing protein [Leuconostoc suionicum]|uniref:phage replisome organizer N-terminal domain-containing protein n=1 Tax=Leuconostoc suionicum TaxID=1511761 RepID=UPI0024AD6223|nr:phage replisome organizer N-terminal domain-containing protein [Leuconostoc suionicum]MDI6497148.1 phage replisome organizer N-terminal domain-containing protein [Leuconostoc suionicum]